MRIVIDIQAAIQKKTGIGAYAVGLTKHLDAGHLDAGEHRYFYLKPKCETDLRLPSRLFWESVQLPLQAGKLKADLIHTVGFSAPLLRPCKVVSTVHDLIGMLFPEHLSAPSRFYWQRWLPYSFKKADHLIASSENTKRDIVRLLSYPEKKITLIPLAAGERFRQIEKSQARKGVQKYVNADRFILYTGTIEPRKNLRSLLLAFAALDADLKRAFPLVICGKLGWNYETLYRLIHEKDLKGNVIFTGYVPDEDLVCFYNAAVVFVYPSFYEGFGLPVLEAMRCGLPVITSNVSSLPEVAGDAAILVNPSSVDELSDALRTLLLNDALREDLSAGALKRSRFFSWEKTAGETRRVYHRLAG